MSEFFFYVLGFLYASSISPRFPITTSFPLGIGLLISFCSVSLNILLTLLCNVLFLSLRAKTNVTYFPVFSCLTALPHWRIVWCTHSVSCIFLSLQSSIITPLFLLHHVSVLCSVPVLLIIYPFNLQLSLLHFTVYFPATQHVTHFSSISPFTLNSVIYFCPHVNVWSQVLDLIDFMQLILQSVCVFLHTPFF